MVPEESGVTRQAEPNTQVIHDNPVSGNYQAQSY